MMENLTWALGFDIAFYTSLVLCMSIFAGYFCVHFYRDLRVVFGFSGKDGVKAACSKKQRAQRECHSVTACVVKR